MINFRFGNLIFLSLLTTGGTDTSRKFTIALQRNSYLCIPRKGIARLQSQFPHSCGCERFISHERSSYFPAAD
jgi:hypothetical protein